MKNLLLPFLFVLSLNTQAALESFFASSVEGLDVPNSHIVGDSYIIRGQTPRNRDEYGQLLDIGVSQVIIFKNQTKNEVDAELEILKKLKIKTTHIEFPWKDITEFAPVCEKALNALKILKENNDREITTFFHCTVGEDRTGVLAALFLQVLGAERDIEKLHREEMCQKGYEVGNPKKHGHVAKTVRENLNPVFLKMSYLLKKANYKLQNVNCAHDFDRDQVFQKSSFSKPNSLSCQAL